MASKYLKGEFEDGVVYFKIDKIDNPEDEYIYEGIELLLEDSEEEQWEKDVYELTEEDLQEMYGDGFCDIDKEEFDDVLAASGFDLSTE